MLCFKGVNKEFVFVSECSLGHVLEYNTIDRQFLDGQIRGRNLNFALNEV